LSGDHSLRKTSEILEDDISDNNSDISFESSNKLDKSDPKKIPDVNEIVYNMIEDEHDKVANELFKPEDQEAGSVSGETFKKFISQLGGPVIIVLVIFLCMGNGLGEQFANKYLIDWSGSFNEDTKWDSLGYFSLFSVLYLICAYSRNIVML